MVGVVSRFSHQKYDDLWKIHDNEKKIYDKEKCFPNAIEKLRLELNSYHDRREEEKKNLDTHYISPQEKKYNIHWVSYEVYRVARLSITHPWLAGIITGGIKGERYAHYEVADSLADLIELSCNIKIPLISSDEVQKSVSSSSETYNDAIRKIAFSIDP
ncbi:MAG: hypothetical protein ACYCT2_05075 [Thermoplasmataceae archaeon]